MKSLKAELGYHDASQIERLIIDQIVLCHFRLYWVENSLTKLGKASPEVYFLWEKRLSANQRRYLRSIETLARVRKLAARTPEILQVNIAQQQVNTLG